MLCSFDLPYGLSNNSQTTKQKLSDLFAELATPDCVLSGDPEREKALLMRFRAIFASIDFDETALGFCAKGIAQATMRHIDNGIYLKFITRIVLMVNQLALSNSKNNTVKEDFIETLHFMIRRKLKLPKEEMKKCEEENRMNMCAIVVDTIVVKCGWKNIELLLGAKLCVCCAKGADTSAEEPSPKRQRLNENDKQNK